MSKFKDMDCPRGPSRESFSLEFHDNVTKSCSSIRAVQAHLALALAGGAPLGRSHLLVEANAGRLTKNKFRSSNSTPRPAEDDVVHFRRRTKQTTKPLWTLGLTSEVDLGWATTNRMVEDEPAGLTAPITPYHDRGYGKISIACDVQP